MAKQKQKAPRTKILKSVLTLAKSTLSTVTQKGTKRTEIAKSILASLLICASISVTAPKSFRAIKRDAIKIQTLKAKQEEAIGGYAKSILSKRAQRKWLTISSHVLREVLPQVPTVVAIATKNATSFQFYALLMASSYATTKVLKLVVAKPRPDKSGETNSFPSGHAMQSSLGAIYTHVNYGFIWSIPIYIGAIFVCILRVADKRHDVIDVFAGAYVAAMYVLYAKPLFKKLVSILQNLLKKAEDKIAKKEG